MIIRDNVKTEDFYKRLANYLDERDVNSALRLFNTLTRTFDKLETLSRVAHALARDLALARAGILARARTNALDLDLVLAHESYLDLTRAIDLARTLTLTLGVISVRLRAHDRTLDFDLDRARAYARFIRAALESFNEVQSFEGSVSERRIEFTYLEKLTPRILAESVSPYLDAVFQLQASINRLNGIENNALDIVSITHHSPVQVEINGGAETIDALSEIILPERRRLANQQKEAEVLAQQLQNMKTQNEIEAEKEDREIERAMKRIELEEKLIALAEKKMEMLIRMYERYAPNVPPEKRIEEAAKLLPTVETFFTMPEVKFLGPPK